MGKRRYISFKVEEDIEHAAALGPVREPWRVRCGRCMRFTGFCLVCTGTLFQALAPWMLSVIEFASLLLLLLLLIRHPPGPYEFHFNSSLEDVVLLGGLRAAALSGTYAWGSTNNHFMLYLVTSYIVGVCGFSYALIKAYCFMYPLEWVPTAAVMATFALFSCMHILAARHTVAWARRRGQLGLAPFEALATLRYSSSAASLADLTDGTAGAGSPVGQWLTGEDVSPELLADLDSQFVDIGGLLVHYKEARPTHWPQPPGDAQPGVQHLLAVEPAMLSRHDDSFEAAANVRSLYQQYQQASSSAAVAAEAQATGVAQPAAAVAAASDSEADVLDAVVFVHGFGGGVFSWRHVLAPLAAALGVRVIALDRPGFGLTSRPQVENSSSARKQTKQQQQQSSEPLLELEQHQPCAIECQASPNPYTVGAQASLVLRLCTALGLRRVVLVGHADGCLVVLHAAAAAVKSMKASTPAPCHSVAGQSGGSNSAVTSSKGHSRRQQQPQQQPAQGWQHHPARVHDMVAGSAAAGLHTSPGIPATGPGQGSSMQPSPMGGSDRHLKGLDPAVGASCEACHDQQHQPQQQAEQCSDAAVTPLQPAAAMSSNVQESFRWSAQRGQVSHLQFADDSVPHAAVNGACSSCVYVCSVVLCGPHLSGHHIQPFTRLLASSSLGRNIIRPLLRSQVGDVRSRGSWYRPELISREVLQLYCAPLHIKGWEAALLASSKAAASVSSRQVEEQLQAIKDMPVLIVTGKADRIAPASKLLAETALLRNSQAVTIPDCGHLPHEEAPAQLVQLLRDFCAWL